MNNTARKIFALILTLTAPLWIIPFLVGASILLCLVGVYEGMLEVYDDMLNLVGAKNERTNQRY